MELNGKCWLRGVSEGAIVRADNGNLVAALRSDMPPRYFDEPHDDSLEGNFSLEAIDPSIVGGKSYETWRMIDEQIRFGDMPPEEPYLTDQQIAAIGRWIDDGALREDEKPEDVHQLLRLRHNQPIKSASQRPPIRCFVEVAYNTWRPSSLRVEARDLLVFRYAYRSCVFHLSKA